MKYSLSLGCILFIIWLLWSGYFTWLLIGIGLLSSVLVVFLARRMDVLDEEGVPLQLGLRPFIYYTPWLLKEIALSNIEVARMILHPKLPIHPKVIDVRATQAADLGRVILANSITLTPGTVSMEMAGDRITVHGIAPPEAEEDMVGEMNRRVTALEAPR